MVPYSLSSSQRWMLLVAITTQGPPISSIFAASGECR